MKVQRNLNSMEGSRMASQENTKAVVAHAGVSVSHIRCASRVRPALASSVLDLVVAGKDGVQAQVESIPKVITIRK